MAFIGNTNTTQGFIPAIDYFSGNGSTVAFTLSRPVASVAQVQANISNVPQNPSSAFSVSGNTITFTSAPPSGTNNIYVYYTSPITQVIAPGQGTVTSESFGTITNFTTTGNTVLGDASTDTLNVGNGGLVKDASGNVGIGISTPSTSVEVRHTTPTITLSPSNYANQYQTTLGTRSGAESYLIFGNNNVNEIRAGRTAAGGYLNFYTNNTVSQTSASDGNLAMQLSAAGNVGIGTSSPVNKLDVLGDVTTAGFYRNADVTIVGTAGMLVNLGARSGSTLTPGAAIGAQLDNPATTGAMLFYTRSSSTLSERARIDSSGNLLVGGQTSSITPYATIQVRGDNKGISIQDSTDNSYRAIYNQSGNLYFYNGSNEGYLSTAGAWINASDAKLKNSIVDIKHGLSSVLNTKPRSYKMNGLDGDYIGFVAQELQPVIPEVVSQSDKQLGVDYGSLVAVAFKAIQEQQAIIQTLTDRITALEGAK